MILDDNSGLTPLSPPATASCSRRTSFRASLVSAGCPAACPLPTCTIHGLPDIASEMAHSFAVVNPTFTYSHRCRRATVCFDDLRLRGTPPPVISLRTPVQPGEVAGPYDNAQRIIAQLTRTAGPVNFDFVVPVGMPPDFL